MRLTRSGAAAVGLLLLPWCVCSCASKCASEKCGPPQAHLVKGTLVTVSRVDGKLISEPTAGQISIIEGLVGTQGDAFKIRTAGSGAFLTLLGTGFYTFAGKSDATGAECNSVGPVLVKAASTATTVTVKCPIK